MRVRIVTDSSTNVPEDYLQRLNIIEAPAVINFGQDSYLYKVEMSLEDILPPIGDERPAADYSPAITTGVPEGVSARG